MNHTSATHLAQARRHLREAVLALLPPVPGQHLRHLDERWRAWVITCLDDDSAPTAPRSGTRKIDIEE
ncbi:hypothetical protein EII34_09050 [Arachnia propionica]|uniref:Uncharacterized protein n=1 Tax=Arachnia propionica TaxID=1750 RepID=A0A3P1T595_9ACTN|nr:hypothetical protein [Arachnia propionica]MDO5083345.1 hypothetical protein [Arachnia propionica]RRD04682.1 hypothetical protein EII34_09050 [Arachnia propionica]